MKRGKLKRQLARAEQGEASLNLVSMIDMFTVLVFFLLVTSTQILFVDTRSLGLSLPGAPPAAADAAPRQDIEIVVRQAEISIGDSAGGLIATVAANDLARFQAVLVELKRRAPTVRKVSVLAEQTLSYQSLVSVLDRVRGYAAVRNGVAVQAELFPEIALGDAPAAEQPANIAKTGGPAT